MPRVRGKRYTKRSTPYKRRSSSKASKRTRSKSRKLSRKAYKSHRPKLVMYNSIVQDKIRTWLTYVDTKVISPANGMASHVFRLNSIFDPDYTGAGHQPAFHDQWQLLYGKYRVIKTTWSITYSPDAPSGQSVVNYAAGGTAVGETHPVYVGFNGHHDRYNHIVFAEWNNQTTNEFTEAADLNFLRETGGKMDHVSWRYRTGNTMRKTISGGRNIKSILEDPDEAGKATAFGVNTSAATTAYLHVGAMSTNGGQTVPIRFNITLKYYVELSNSAAVGES